MTNDPGENKTPVGALTDLLEKTGASNPEVRPLPGSRRHDKCWPET